MTEMHHDRDRRLRVLFLCTANASRSQIAEALLAWKGQGRFEVASAGMIPAAAVHPMAIEALREYGIDWTRQTPKGLGAVLGQQWDFVITVCEPAKEACPTFPGRPAYADWGVPDPTAIEDEAARRVAFRHVVHHMARRIDLMLAVPMEKLMREAQEERLRAIGRVPDPDAVVPMTSESVH
jgi:arsenate reductase